MPDGTAWRGVPLAAEIRASRGQRRATAAAGVLAVALHAAALAPFLREPMAEQVVAIADAVEVAPLPEAVAPAPSDSAAVAEPLAAVAPEEFGAASAPPAAQPQPVEAVPSEPPPEEVAEADPNEAIPALDQLAAVPPPPPPVPRPRPASTAPRQPPRVAPESQLAPAAESAAAPPPPAAAVAPDARRPPPSYVGTLMAALERQKTYPPSARARRAEGAAVLRFAMRRDGSVVGWRIERSTGDRDLDGAVERMIRTASPLPAPPEELPGDVVEMVVPVRFRLR